MKTLQYVAGVLAVCCAVVHGQESLTKKGFPKTKGALGKVSWQISETSLSRKWLKTENLGLSMFPIHIQVDGGVEEMVYGEQTGVPMWASVANPLTSGTIDTLLIEGFEGTFPSGLWRVFDGNGTTNGEYYWGKRTFRKRQGSYSAWCVGAGANGSNLANGADYPANATSHMVYGPFSLAGVNYAALNFYVWLDTESNFDYFSWSASIDGNNFYGYAVSGSSGGSWVGFTFPLTDVPTLGNVTGRPSVWIKFGFTSDQSFNYKGVYVDDVALVRGMAETLPVLGSFPSPSTYPWGLSYGGAFLWGSDRASDRVYKLNTVGSSLSSFATPGSDPAGLAWDGSYLWHADFGTGRVYKLTSGGTSVTSFSAPGADPSGLGWDGTRLWLCDLNQNTVWKLTPSGQVVGSFSVPGTFHTGLEWDGQSLWLADGEAEVIYKLDPAGNLEDFYLPPGTFPTDIAWDGSDLWIADADNDRIYKVMAPLRGPEPRASFTVTPTSGFLETIFTVDASSSQDEVTPSGDLEVRWDWENDGTYDTDYSKVKTANHQYYSPGTKTIKLEVRDTDGYTGRTSRSVTVNTRAPQAFSLLSPRSGDTVRTFLPAFRWRRAHDADPGDTVRYFLHYSTSSLFSSFQTVPANTDTTAAALDSLRELQRYYWRVEAVDRWGTRTMSSQTWNFLVADLTPPSFTIGILQNPIMTEDLDLYVISNERLDQNGVRCLANGIPVSMPVLDPERRIYVGDYQLSSSGRLVVIVTGKDAIWGNEGVDSLSISVQLMKAVEGGMITSVDNALHARFPAGAVPYETYVLVYVEKQSQVEANYIDEPGVNHETVAISRSYKIEPAGLQLKGPVSLEIMYMDEEVAGLDEEKLELAIRSDDGWKALGGTVDTKSNKVTLEVNQLGEYRLQWNSRRTPSRALPSAFMLLQNYPNPFNPTTTLRYGLPERFQGRVDIGVFDPTGREIVQLVDKTQNAGYYQVTWDGRDSSGRPVPSGIYYCRMRTNGFSSSVKMIFLR